MNDNFSYDILKTQILKGKRQLYEQLEFYIKILK